MTTKRSWAALSWCALALSACASGSIGSRPYPVPMHATRPLATTEAETVERHGFALLLPTSSADRAQGYGATSFHLGYTAIFRAHQPVYITADAILHAWHSSYDAMLADLEEGALAPALQSIVDDMRRSLGAMPKAKAARPDAGDVDVLLAVASQLLKGKPDEASSEATREIVKAAEAATGPGAVTLFGTTMKVDFSMMKPRGHYTRSATLQRYFRAMTWLGRTEIRIAEPDASGAMRLNRRALAASVLLRSLVSPSAERTWRAIDEAVGSFVGPHDSMSFLAIDEAAKALGKSPADLTDLDEAALLATFAPLAEQRIGSQLTHQAPGKHAIAILFMGQRYVFDAHVMSRVVYGGLQTKRMMPSSLDVASVVFKNPSATQLLAPEVARFGAEYKDALDHMAKERDAAGEALWSTSLHHAWLSALRELSPDPERDMQLPAPFKSEAWGRRMLNTQLASWAELRHDNLLYAKQSFTTEAGCEYPEAYVEPYPRFFAILEKMAKDEKASLERLSLTNKAKTRMTRYLDGFADTLSHLRVMAERERRNEPLDANDLDFLNRMVAVKGRNAVCTTIIEPEGWYADLHYDRDEILVNRPIIADVHTQPTDEMGNTVGRILHAATGDPRLFVVKIAHDGGKHTTTYRGFASTYAERTTNDFKRLTDEEWRVEIASKSPSPPPWLEDIVVR